MVWEAMDICLRLLKESNKSRFDSYSVRNSVFSISRITFRDCRVHILSDNLSRNSCIQILRYSKTSVTRILKGKEKQFMLSDQLNIHFAMLITNCLLIF